MIGGTDEVVNAEPRSRGDFERVLVNSDHAHHQIAVVGRALDLLADVARGRRHTTVSAAEATGTSRASAYRMLVTLESRGFLEHDREAHSWGPGALLFDITAVSTREQLRATAMPLLAALRDRELETVNLAWFGNGRLVYTDVLESPLRFRMGGARGEHAPLYSTALGRAVLASLPSEEQASLLAQARPEPLTERTVVDTGALVDELAVARTRGWAAEHGETELGVSCFGAALVGPSGRPVGAISISVPDARLDPKRERHLGAAIRQVAEAITDALPDAGRDGHGSAGAISA
jgi:IclR family acetate operon transcriptional repressor